jgi:hypothetical protein
LKLRIEIAFTKSEASIWREVIYQSAAGADPPIFVEILLLSATE